MIIDIDKRFADLDKYNARIRRLARIHAEKIGGEMWKQLTPGEQREVIEKVCRNLNTVGTYRG